MRLIYEDDQKVRSITSAFLKQTLPKEQWTHAAHFAVSLCLEREYPDFDLATELPKAIYHYNEAVGTANSDTGGYHETITFFYIKLIQFIDHSFKNELSLNAVISSVMESELGKKEFPLRFYSKEILDSTHARRHRVEPDIKPLDFGL